MARMHKELRTHSHNARTLAESAKIYARDKTPAMSRDGVISELDAKPGGPDLAARHMREIRRTSGETGARRKMQELQATRGNQFVLQMMKHDRGVKDLLTPQRTSNPGIPDAVQTALDTSDAGQPLSVDLRDRFAHATGHDPADVRLFDDRRAHDAAASVGARAFTVGQRIFFNRGENHPGSASGRELLMHELAHTVQQKGAGNARAAELEISTPGDRDEREAEQVARSVLDADREAAANDGQETDGPVAGSEVLQAGSARNPRLQRVISFTVASHDPTVNNVAADERADGFILTSADPTFEWTPDVTIHGDAADPFAEWETAHHQVAKGFWTNIWWGTGADRTHRNVTMNGGLPMRDATAAGNTWYSDWRAQGFAADGDVRSPVMHDQPNTALIPWDNPMVGRAGNSGSYNYGFGFVATVSARHTTAGTDAAAFRHLGHMHWNFALNGTFNAALPLHGRVTVTDGAVNHSAMFAGFDAANPPMHGGAICNDNFLTTDT